MEWLALIIMFVLIIYLLAKVGGLEVEVARLRTLVEHRDRAAWPVGAFPAQPQPAQELTVPSPVKAPTHIVVPPPQPAGTATSALSEPEPPPAPVPAPTSVPPKPRGRRLTEALPSLTQNPEWEALIGATWLNRIGAVALILGVGFFFKYAVDQNWISQSVRVVIGLVFGAALIVGAEWGYRKGYAIFAQGLIGAGLGTLYFALYASYNFYHLVPGTLALAALGAVTALAFVEAVRHDSAAVAALAWIGGFLTPLLLVLQQPDEIGLFAYLLLLVAGIMGLLVRKPGWYLLQPPTVIATYGVYALWFGRSYTPAHLLMTTLFVSALWALFLAYEARTVLIAGRWGRELGHALSATNGAFYVLALFALLQEHHRFTLGVAIGATAGTYAGLVLALHRVRGVPAAMVLRYTLMVATLIVIDTWIEVDGNVLAAVWAIEALAFLLVGIRWNLLYLWRIALVVYGLAAVALLSAPGAFAYEPIAQFTVLLNTRVLTFAVVCAAAAAGALVLARSRDDDATPLAPWMHGGWNALVFLLLTVETNDLFRHLMVGKSGLTAVQLDYSRYLAVAAVWMLYSLVLSGAAARLRHPWAGIVGVTLAGVSALLALAAGAAYQPIERYVPVLNVRAGLLLLLLAVVMAHLRLLRVAPVEGDWKRLALPGLQILAILTPFELLTAEINDFFRHLGPTAIARQGTDVGLFLELAVLAALWMAIAVPLVRVGLQRESPIALNLGLCSAALSVLGGVVPALAVLPGSEYGMGAAVRAAVLLLLIAGLFLLLRELQEHTRRSSQGGTADLVPHLGAVQIGLQAVIVLLGFALVSSETRDWFDERVSSASSTAAPRLRDVEQLVLSLVWLVYAIGLLAVGLWRRTRWLRLGSMALFGFIIVKIFAYDLSFLAPAYRSFSLAGLGVVLLAVSFLYQRYRGVLMEASGS